MSTSDQENHLVVALVGAPNSGKTTLYNWLTNSKFKTVNYPGATVEYSIGLSAERYGKQQFFVMDTPGTYSLFPKSADEEVTLKAIYGHPKYGFAKKIVVVIDGTHLERNLLIAKQIQSAGFSYIIAITMSDLLHQVKMEIDLDLIRREFKAPVVLIDGSMGGGILNLVEEIRKIPETSMPKKLQTWSSRELANHLRSLENFAKKVYKGSEKEKLKKLYNKTEKIDYYFLHPVGGMILFLLIMTSLFSSIFWLAQPFMNWIDEGFSFLSRQISTWSLGGELWTDFLANGVISSFSSVFVFVPQIFILFMGISLLESSGYLARAATLIDRPFSKIGLSGRSFVPLLSGFACAVPAMMASRNLGSVRDRWITNFIIPLMTCSARLPVYALLLSFIFKEDSSWKPGLFLTLIYLFSIVLGTVAAGILNKILPDNKKSFFMMELPLYRSPQWKILLSQALSRTKAYVKKAGPVIFIFAVLVWFGTSFPNYKAEQTVKLQSSYLGKVGQVIEPIFTPMGVDWRVGVGLLSAFAAREVFVSALAVIFNVADDSEAQQEGLIKTMQEAKLENGMPLFTVSSVIGLVVFFMIALQCMTTFAIAIRESGSLKYALTQLIVYNIAGYLLAVAVVQGLRAVGVA